MAILTVQATQPGSCCCRHQDPAQKLRSRLAQVLNTWRIFLFTFSLRTNFWLQAVKSEPNRASFWSPKSVLPSLLMEPRGQWILASVSLQQRRNCQGQQQFVYVRSLDNIELKSSISNVLMVKWIDKYIHLFNKYLLSSYSAPMWRMNSKQDCWSSPRWSLYSRIERHKTTNGR